MYSPRVREQEAIDARGEPVGGDFLDRPVVRGDVVEGLDARAARKLRTRRMLPPCVTSTVPRPSSATSRRQASTRR